MKKLKKKLPRKPEVPMGNKGLKMTFIFRHVRKREFARFLIEIATLTLKKPLLTSL